MILLDTMKAKIDCSDSYLFSNIIIIFKNKKVKTKKKTITITVKLNFKLN